MSGWLSRAKEAFGGGREAADVPEPIEIACPCGRKVEAIRRPAFQRVLCKDCGEPFFLLPLDVYPRPVMKVRKVQPSKSAATTKSSTKSAATEAAAAPARPSIDLHAGFVTCLAKVRAQFSPLRLVVLSLLAVIGLTGWWQWNRAGRSQADVDFKAASEAGLAALQKKDLVEAAQHFGRAAAAADILRRTDVPAEQARQRFRQLTAINSLMSRSLRDLLEVAKAARLRGDVAAVEADFAALHVGRWLVLQSEITPAADNSAPPAGGPSLKSNARPVSTWEQRVQIDGEVLVLTGTLPLFAKVRAPSSAAPVTPPHADVAANPATPTPLDAALPVAAALNDLGQREVVFAAQVESLKWDADQSSWVLTLNPSSAFLWSDYDLLLAAGLTPDELRTEAQLRALLLEQSRWIGAAE